MKANRLLHQVHKWTGLITGINVLILSLTGAWLVFAEEIEAAFPGTPGEQLFAVDPKGETPIQAAVDELKKLHPEMKPASVFMPEDTVDTYDIYLQEGIDHFEAFRMNTATGSVSKQEESTAEAINHFILHLHADLFLGTIGIIILGIVATLFLLSTVTGIFIYAPFMKQALYGALQWKRGKRRFSADLHKLVGATSLSFNLVISLTGIALTLGFMVVRVWVYQEVVAATHAGLAGPVGATTLPPVDLAMRHAQATLPDIPLTSISFPGELQGENHFFSFHEDRNSIARFIPSVGLVPIADVTQAQALFVPLWVKAMLISVPFHFGNFAGLGVKLAWCFFGLSAGALSVSGAILSFSAWGKKYRMRRRRLAGEVAPEPQPIEGEA